MDISIGEIVSGTLVFSLYLIKAIALSVLMTTILIVVVGGAFFIISSPFRYRAWIKSIEVSPEMVVRLTFWQFYRLCKSMPNEFEIGHISDRFEGKSYKIFYRDVQGCIYQIQFSFGGWILYRVEIGFESLLDLLKKNNKTKSERRDNSFRNTEKALRIVNDMQDKLKKGIAP